MAFCNSCGAALAEGTKFCNKCGAVVAGSAAAASGQPPAAPAPASKGGSSALKIILIVIAVFVVIGILGMVTCGIVLHHIAKHSHVTQHGDKVKVETPFGTINANDPEQAVKDLGIEVYPGAEAQKAGSADLTFGSVHTVTANFTSSDSVNKVCDFYKSKFPAANVKTYDPNRCTIVSEDSRNVITVNVQTSGDTTRFQITSVTRK
jgi:CRISPR/Cas system CMR subunit Cmr4 (Cas7 group RAMP superfamily)